MVHSNGGRIARDGLHLALPIAVGRSRSPAFWHLLAVPLDAGEEFVTQPNRFRSILVAEGPPDTAFAAAKMERVRHPVIAISPSASVDVQVVRWLA